MCVLNKYQTSIRVINSCITLSIKYNDGENNTDKMSELMYIEEKVINKLYVRIIYQMQID